MSDEVMKNNENMDSISGMELSASSSSVASNGDAAVKPKRVNLLKKLSAAEMSSTLESVRLSENETAMIIFGADAEETMLHYCDEAEIKGYVVCNGPDCVLCRAGRKAEARFLVPVYLPGTRCISVLATSKGMRPHALFPQLQPILMADRPKVAFVKKDGMAKFLVTVTDLPAHADDGREVIAEFCKRWEAGAVSLVSAFQKIPNEQLKCVPAIASILELKGIA